MRGMLRSLNHFSLAVTDVETSVRFYRDFLGFEEIKRPSQFDFDGSWLWGYGIGIHLIGGGQAVKRHPQLDPKSDHLSFIADDLAAVVASLEERGIKHISTTVVEDGIEVQQVFFHDPSGFMIEICNCDALPICPLRRQTDEARSPCALAASRDSMDSDSVCTDVLSLHAL